MQQQDWSELAASMVRRHYDATPADRHYGKSQPWTAPVCRCAGPWLYTDEDGASRCSKCGSTRPSAGAASRA